MKITIATTVQIIHNASRVAEVAELVDARDSKSRAARRAGSIPALGTKEHLVHSNKRR